MKLSTFLILLILLLAMWAAGCKSTDVEKLVKTGAPLSQAQQLGETALGMLKKSGPLAVDPSIDLLTDQQIKFSLAIADDLKQLQERNDAVEQRDAAIRDAKAGLVKRLDGTIVAGIWLMAGSLVAFFMLQSVGKVAQGFALGGLAGGGLLIGVSLGVKQAGPWVNVLLGFCTITVIGLIVYLVIDHLRRSRIIEVGVKTDVVMGKIVEVAKDALPAPEYSRIFGEGGVVEDIKKAAPETIPNIEKAREIIRSTNSVGEAVAAVGGANGTT